MRELAFIGAVGFALSALLIIGIQLGQLRLYRDRSRRARNLLRSLEASGRISPMLARHIIQTTYTAHELTHKERTQDACTSSR
jgi:hypothetical protein